MPRICADILGPLCHGYKNCANCHGYVRIFLWLRTVHGLPTREIYPHILHTCTHMYPLLSVYPLVPTGMVHYIAPWPAMVIRGIANTAAAGGPLGSVQPVGIGCT